MNTNKKIKFLIKESDNSYGFFKYLEDLLGYHGVGPKASEMLQAAGTTGLGTDIPTGSKMASTVAAAIPKITMEDVHLVLDILGMVEIPIYGPVTAGMVFDFTNAALYLAEGDAHSAAVCFIFGLVPVLGDAYKLNKLSRITDPNKIQKSAITILKVIDDGIKAAEKLKTAPKFSKAATKVIEELTRIKNKILSNPAEGLEDFYKFMLKSQDVKAAKPSRISTIIQSFKTIFGSFNNINYLTLINTFRPRDWTLKLFYFNLSFYLLLRKLSSEEGKELLKDIYDKTTKKLDIDPMTFIASFITNLFTSSKDQTDILKGTKFEKQLQDIVKEEKGKITSAKLQPRFQKCLSGEMTVNWDNEKEIKQIYPYGLCYNEQYQPVGFITAGSSGKPTPPANPKDNEDIEPDIPPGKRIKEGYVPQTGRGFSDGNEHVGKKTKGPYEYVAEEDTPWYKKKYKEDSKNLKILIGHGSKTPKYAKKGGPFTQDPPKRRPVNKLSAPPMALDEMTLPSNFKEAFLKLTNAEVSFKVLKDINTTVLFKDVLVFKQGQTYQGIISGNDILLKATEIGNKTLTKEEFLQKLEQAKGELCQSVDCKASKIKSGNNILTFDEFMQSASQPQQAEEPREKGYTELEKARMAQNTTLAGNIAANVANGVDIKQAINNEIGYHPIAQSFSNKFYEIMTKALENIKDPDEKKAAALLTVLFGNITMIPIDAAARVYGEIPQDAIKSAMNAVSKIYAPIAEKIQELQEMWKKIEEKLNVGNIVDKVKEKAQDITKIGTDLIRDYEITDLKKAKQNKNEAIILGDQQKTTLYRGFNSIISAKGYQASRTFDFPANSNFGDVEKNSSFERFITDNKDKIGLFFISFGSSDRIAQVNTVEAVKLIKFLKQRVPDVEIIWVGSPPLQKAQPDFSKKNDSLKSNNEAIAMAKAIPLLNFIFVDPFKYLGSDEPSGIYTDGVNLSDNGAKKVLSGALSGGKQNITADSNDLNNINDFIISRQDISVLSDDFKFELIKLSKRAKEIFGTAAKINVISGKQGREETTNHGTGKAADIRINDGKKDLTAQQTYALLITSVLDGIIKDGGIGYYANTVGTYDPEKMDVTQEYPHYDILGVRKWFWFKCEPDKNKCEQRVNSRYFKEGQKSGPNEYQTSAALSAAEVADEDNPLKLPEDVFKLIGQYRRSKTKTAETSVADLFKEDFLNSLSSEQKNNMSIIDNVFTDAGYSKNVTAAAIVNSYAEAGMISSTVGISGSPVGLFQIIRTYSGLDPKISDKTRDDFVKMAQSKGLDPKSSSTHSILRRKYKDEWDSYVQNRLDDGDYRFDPEKNAKKIVSWTSRMKHVKDADEKDKKSIPELTAIFTEKVEVAGNDVTPLKRKEKAEGFLKVKRA